MTWQRFRDLSISEELIMACDSMGGIGEKEGDVLKVSPEISGYFLARVPIMECICYGSTPYAYTLLICNEMEPTGSMILRGVEKAFAELKLDVGAVNGSTEENMATSMTAAGITVLARPEKSLYRKPQAGERLLYLGLPQVGEEVLGSPWKLQVSTLQRLRQDPRISDMLPVGSHGIAYEVREMERTSGLKLCWQEQDQELMKKSGGPSTCVLISLEPEALEMIQGLGIPWGILGTFQ